MQDISIFTIPTFTDVLSAQKQIRPYLARTLLHRYPAMDALIGTEVYLKDGWTPVKIGE